MADQMNEEQIAEYKLAFALFDKKGDGSIITKVIITPPSNSAPLFDRLAKTPPKPSCRTWSTRSTQTATAMAPLSSQNSYHWFQIYSTRSRKKKETEEELIEALKAFKLDRNELISATELRHTMRNFGGEADGRGSGRDDREADIDRDVHTNYEEYERVIMIWYDMHNQQAFSRWLLMSRRLYTFWYRRPICFARRLRSDLEPRLYCCMSVLKLLLHECSEVTVAWVFWS